MSTFAFMTYEQWLEQNPDAIKNDIECPDCIGTGETTCFHCGSIVECSACEGSGKIQSSREEYEMQLHKDKKLVESYSKLIGV